MFDDLIYFNAFFASFFLLMKSYFYEKLFGMAAVMNLTFP